MPRFNQEGCSAASRAARSRPPLFCGSGGRSRAPRGKGRLKLTWDSALSVGCPPAYPPERTAGAPRPRSDSKRWPKYQVWDVSQKAVSHDAAMYYDTTMLFECDRLYNFTLKRLSTCIHTYVVTYMVAYMHAYVCSYVTRTCAGIMPRTSIVRVNAERLIPHRDAQTLTLVHEEKTFARPLIQWVPLLDCSLQSFPSVPSTNQARV